MLFGHPIPQELKEQFEKLKLLQEDVDKDNWHLHIANSIYIKIEHALEKAIGQAIFDKIRYNPRLYSFAPQQIIPSQPIIETTSGYQLSIIQSINKIPHKLIVNFIVEHDLPDDMKIAYDTESKSILLPYLDANYNFTTKTVVLFLQSPGLIRHELYHWIDDIEYDIEKYSLKNNDYYNDPIELHAYTQQMIRFLVNQAYSQVNTESELKKFSDPKNIREQWVNFKAKDIDLTLYQTSTYEYGILCNFFNHLTEQNKKKVISKVCRYFQEIVAKRKESDNV